MSLSLANISHKLEKWKPMSFQITATSCCSLEARVLSCKVQGPWFNSQTWICIVHLALFADECVIFFIYVFIVVWYGIV